MVEAHSLFRYAVQIRGIIDPGSVTADCLGRVIVGHDENYIWLISHKTTFCLCLHIARQLECPPPFSMLTCSLSCDKKLTICLGSFEVPLIYVAIGSHLSTRTVGQNVGERPLIFRAISVFGDIGVSQRR